MIKLQIIHVQCDEMAITIHDYYKII